MSKCHIVGNHMLRLLLNSNFSTDQIMIHMVVSCCMVSGQNCHSMCASLI